MFRDGTDELMTSLERRDVPVLILSAGLGDLIQEILKYFKVTHLNRRHQKSTGMIGSKSTV
jgi:hypothetical protein